jgi:hypothetical protein
MPIEKECTSGKRRYFNKDLAMRHVARLRAQGATNNASCAYRCKLCGGWHVGHRPGSFGRNRKRRWHGLAT